MKTMLLKKNRRRTIWAIAAWILVLLWGVCIFRFSAQTAGESSQLSGGLLQKILAVLPFPISEFALRKLAHFSEFLLLAVLCTHAFFASTGRCASLAAWTLTVLYAISDEVHQLFVPGRACQIQDILIDAAGALLGALLAHFLVQFYISHCKQKKKEGETYGNN